LKSAKIENLSILKIIKSDLFENKPKPKFSLNLSIGAGLLATVERPS
jgi:hypothetical protein